jgi:hypothetical protein
VKHLKDLRCCDGDAVTLECHVEGTPEPNVFWEKDGKILHDRSTEHRQNFNGHKATLSIPRVFPEDEGQYCLVACNNMGRVKSSACIIVDGNCILIKNMKSSFHTFVIALNSLIFHNSTRGERKFA